MGRGRSHGLRGLPPAYLLGLVLLLTGLVLLFVCVPGWAWTALVGVVLTALGLWLLTLGAG